MVSLLLADGGCKLLYAVANLGRSFGVVFFVASHFVLIKFLASLLSQLSLLLTQATQFVHESLA